MRLVPKRKLLPARNLGSIGETIEYITNISPTEEFTGTLDDILDGILYGKVLQTNLLLGALRIITAQSSLLNMIPATNDVSDLGSSSKLWRYLYTHDISLNTDITPVTTDTSKLGSSSKEFAEGYVKKTYHDTRLQIPVGTDMYD